MAQEPERNPRSSSPQVDPTSKRSGWRLGGRHNPEAESGGPTTTSNAKDIGLGIIVLTAVISAIASAVINPDLISGLFRSVTGGGSETTPPSAAATGMSSSPKRDLVLEQKVHPSGSITYVAPVDWPAGSVQANGAKGRVAGDGLAAREDDSTDSDPDRPQFYVAASRTFARQLKIPAEGDPNAPLLKLLRSFDWTRDGCHLVGETPTLSTDQIPGVMRKWDGCRRVQRGTFWEGYSVSKDRSTVVIFQLNSGDDLTVKQCEIMLRSVQVDVDLVTG